MGYRTERLLNTALFTAIFPDCSSVRPGHSIVFKCKVDLYELLVKVYLTGGNVSKLTLKPPSFDHLSKNDSEFTIPNSISTVKFSTNVLHRIVDSDVLRCIMNTNSLSNLPGWALKLYRKKGTLNPHMVKYRLFYHLRALLGGNREQHNTRVN